MPDLYMDVDIALSEVPVNIFPLTDDTDMKTRETAVVYNAAGMALVWNFVTTGGAYTQTAVTPTTAGTYDWAHQGGGMYSIEIPASGGASINNDTEGFGWFTGFATGVLPWRGPIIGFRAVALNDALIDGGDNLDVNTVQFNGTNATASGGRPEVNTTHIAGSSVSTSSAQLGVNVVNAGGTAWGSGAITAASIASGAITSAKFAAGALDAVWSVATRTLTAISDSSGVTTLLSKLSGITSLAEWLGLLAGKQTGNTTARTEIRATGAGSGTFNETTDSLEAVRDRGDAAWITATGFSTLDAAGVRSAVGLASANLDTQLGDIPTNAELATAVANVSVDEIQATAIADLFNTDSGTTYASAVAGSAVKEIADNAGGSALTAAGIADAVWDEALAGHLTAGSTGNALNAAGSAGDPWSTLIPGAYGAGTAGKILGDNINATISSRATQTSVDTIDDYVDTEVSAIKAKTDNLPSDPADASDIASAFAGVNTKLDTIDGRIDTEVAAIKAKTDQLTFTVANQLDANIQSVNDVTVTGNGQPGNEWGP